MKSIDLLGKVIEISHSNLEITSRINSIVNIIAKEMECEEVTLYTLDRDKRLTCRFKNNKSILFGILNQYRCHIGEGVIGSVAQRRAPQFYSKHDIPPRFGCLFYPELDGILERYKTFAFLPVSDDSYIYGVLVLGSSTIETLHDSEKIILSILSREIGGIFRFYELTLSSTKRISELVTLTELGKILSSNVEPHDLLKNIALIVARAMNAAFVSIRIEKSILALETERFTYGTMDSSVEQYIIPLEEKCVQLKKSISLKDYAEKVAEDKFSEFFMYVSPIISKNRILGTLLMGGEKSQQSMVNEEDAVYLIDTIARYLSTGLETTLLNIRLRDVLKELGDAQKRLVEQEKFRSLGEMTASIAHEIKNPLAIIGGFTKRLANKVKKDEAEWRYIDIIIKEVSRLESILNELLNYVKDVPIANDVCMINDCIDEVIYLFAPDAAWENIHFVREYDTTIPPIKCDVQQIKQVFINILMNSFEAMTGKGTITVKTGQTYYRGKPYVTISIADTGGGIEPAIIDNIFNPFFTTKERGTGLGLAISNKIVMNHGGHIEVNNNVGKGVTFVVYLPIKNNIM